MPNPGLGLWAYRGRFEASEAEGEQTAATDASEGGGAGAAAAEEDGAAASTEFAAAQEALPSVDVGVGGPK